MTLDIMTPTAREIAMGPRMCRFLRYMIEHDRQHILAASARAEAAEIGGYDASAARERRVVEYGRRCLVADLALAEEFYGTAKEDAT